LQGGKFLADYEYSPAQAIEAYKDWKQSLWFAPENFLEILDPLQLNPVFLPFYSFALFTHTAHHGKVGHIKKQEEGDNNFGIEYEFVPGRRSTFVNTQHHPESLAYAAALTNETPSYELVKEIWYWKTDRLRFVDSHAGPYRLGFHQTKSFDVRMLPPSPVSEAWTHAQRRLCRNERYIAELKFKREFKCDVVEDVQTETRFSHIVVKLVYLPMYIWSHEYEGAKYHTIMNAQNGLIYGTRPYRLKGSFESAIKAITGGHISNASSEVINGADLATRDGFRLHNSPYHPHLPYLLFPPSDQFLVFMAIGTLRIKNTSSTDPVELKAQKRISSEFGKELVMAPGADRTISYRGAWCFCVTRGDPKSVVIAHVSTNSGSEKDDLVGMV